MYVHFFLCLLYQFLLAGMMKKKKKLKKKGAPVGGVAVFGGTDLFGGKNPFANRKVDPSSGSEEDSMDVGSSTPGAASAEPNKQQTELRLPFGEHSSTDNKEKPKPPARKSSSSTKLSEKAQATLEPKKKEDEPKTPEEKGLQVFILFERMNF